MANASIMTHAFAMANDNVSTQYSFSYMICAFFCILFTYFYDYDDQYNDYDDYYNCARVVVCHYNSSYQ